MDLSPAIKLIKEFEGCRLVAYLDPVGIPTIGYGTTKNVKIGMKVTKAEAEMLLMDDLNRERVPAVKKMVKVACTNNELCALVSFCYNVGVGALQKSTLLKKLNANKSDEEVANEFLKWTKAKGKVLKGLVRRRQAERKLFLTREAVKLGGLT